MEASWKAISEIIIPFLKMTGPRIKPSNANIKVTMIKGK